MHIRTILEAYKFSSEKMQKTNLFATDELLLDIYCLEPNQKQKIHVHQSSSKVYIVLEGHGDFHVDGEIHQAVAGQAILAPAGKLHGVENNSSDRLVVLVGMAPPPPHR